MIRFISAASIVAVALAVVPAAFAKDIKETKTFTKADGTKVVSHTNFHTKTDVTDVKVTKTKTDGQVRTVSEKISPDHKGGFEITKTVTGFNGNMTTTHSSVGPGHSSQASSGSGSQGGGHGGGGHGKA